MAIQRPDNMPRPSVSDTAPKIQDGYWWTYNSTLGKYANTGQRAQGDRGAAGAAGKDGKSAYQSAQEGGFSGEETAFNAALAHVSDKIDDPEVKSEGQVLTFHGGKWSAQAPAKSTAPKKYARLVVGTAAAGGTTANVDHFCDGKDDQTEINAAIQALPASGGEIVLLDGTYNLSGNIEVNKVGVKLRGSGAATVLKAMAANVRIIHITKENCTVSDLVCDGNKNENTIGIYLAGDSSTIRHVLCRNGKDGMGGGGKMNLLTENTVQNNSAAGIWFSAEKNIIIGNRVSGNGDGFYLGAASNHNVITGNSCTDNGKGMNCVGSNNTITGNVFVRGTGTGADYSPAQATISVTGKNNLITGNSCAGKAPTDSGTNNTLTNNKS